MRKEFYYSYEDARREAEAYANEHGGHIAPHSAAVDDRTAFDYEDRGARNLSWSGETAAIVVRDNSSYEDIAIFAYWE